MPAHQAGTVEMTRKEAETFMAALTAARIDCVKNIRKAERARTWTHTLKVVTIQNETANLDALIILQERIGTVFNLGGY